MSYANRFADTEFRRSYWKTVYHRNAQRIRDFKESRPCVDCGGFFPHYVTDLDHLRDKTLNVSKMSNYSLVRIEAELAKCELVCANCHRIRTHERRSENKELTGPQEPVILSLEFERPSSTSG